VKIVVCIKRVPDTEARIRVAADGRSVDVTGVKFITNPYDEFALEAALRLREAEGEGEVVALSLGDTGIAETLRAALAMGADSAVHLTTDRPLEGLAAAHAIAAELSGRDFDLALFGLKAIDDDLQAVGVMVAELIDLPAATAVTEFRREGDRIIAEREVEGGMEVVELPTPCILTITKGAYEPRYASLKGIMAAKKKPFEEKAAMAEGDGGIQVESLQPPPERQPGRIVGEGPDAVPELLRILREQGFIA